MDNSTINDESKNFATTNTQLTGGSQSGSYSMGQFTDRQVYADALLNANKTWENWSLSAQLSLSVSDQYYAGNNVGGPISSTQLANKFNVYMLDQALKTTGQSQSQHQVQSVYAQAELGWKSAYYLTVTGRNDWDSALFGPLSTKHSFYPSVGLQ